MQNPVSSLKLRWIRAVICFKRILKAKATLVGKKKFLCSVQWTPTKIKGEKHQVEYKLLKANRTNPVVHQSNLLQRVPVSL